MIPSTLVGLELKMKIQIKRVYDIVEPDDGIRCLVDRLWPRGIRKTDLQLDEWAKELAPSAALRRLYHAKKISWNQFQRRYWAELESNPHRLSAIAQVVFTGNLTLLTASSDKMQNHAIVLRDFLLRIHPQFNGKP